MSNDTTTAEERSRLRTLARASAAEAAAEGHGPTVLNNLLPRLLDERDALEAENAWLSEWRDRVIDAAGSISGAATCIHCGFPAEKNSEAMRDHIRSCAKNPAVVESAALRAQVETLNEQVRSLTSERDVYHQNLVILEVQHRRTVEQGAVLGDAWKNAENAAAALSDRLKTAERTRDDALDCGCVQPDEGPVICALPQGTCAACAACEKRRLVAERDDGLRALDIERGTIALLRDERDAAIERAEAAERDRDEQRKRGDVFSEALGDTRDAIRYMGGERDTARAELERIRAALPPAEVVEAVRQFMIAEDTEVEALLALVDAVQGRKDPA